VYEENREFSADQHGMVKPLADHFIGVRLDYWQLFEGENSTKPGPFLRKMGHQGLDTGDQIIVSPGGERLDGPRSWKNRTGFTPKALLAIAAKYPGNGERKNLLRLSWFLLDPDPFRKDLGGHDPQSPGRNFTSAEGAVAEARKARRPLIRVEGKALTLLENNQEFLRRHLRQFWWHKGDPNGPARLVVMDTNNISPTAKPSELTGSCSPGKVPQVLTVLDLSGGVNLDKLSPALDRAWARYMMNRPSNADNLTFAKENVASFKEVDQTIRQLAKEGSLLAPGGRKLYR
jgi:hypothetical protein